MDTGLKKGQKTTVWKSATKAVHIGVHRSQERENSPAIYLTSSYVFHNAEQAEAIFAAQEPGNIYSRFTNPSVSAFEERLAAMEEGEKGLATASGMAAITAVFLALLSSGDHVVLSRSVFGSTTNLANTVLSRFGIGVTKVALSDLTAWEEAITPKTRLFFVETPANPTLEMVDLAALAKIAQAKGVLLAVDNVFCTPCLQRPLTLGADIVVHSATKYIDGQGRVLGGAIIGKEELLMEKIYPFLRNSGPSLSPFNAWVLFKSLETLSLRMQKHCDNTEAVIQALMTDARWQAPIHYPGLAHHPQHLLAGRQMDRFGSIFCLDLGDKKTAHRFMNALQLVTITANLGDSRSLITHPATTTHAKVAEAERLAAGVGNGLIRISIGLEDPEDIAQDLLQAWTTTTAS